MVPTSLAQVKILAELECFSLEKTYHVLTDVQIGYTVVTWYSVESCMTSFQVGVKGIYLA